MNKLRTRIVVILVLVFWMGLTGFVWFLPAKQFSDSERRNLKQMPELSLDSVLNGSFMKDFESFTQDQFPWRDTFRTIKALTAYNVFLKMDNNDIYVTQGQAAKLDYPVNQTSVQYAVDRLTDIYKTYLENTDAKVYFSIVPDKGYYLAEKNGYLAMDYKELEQSFVQALTFAEYISLFGTLDASDYYATDSHWKQECLSETVSALAQAMGISDKLYTEYDRITADSPFYGVYYGQAALPMEPDKITYLTNKQLDACTVTYVNGLDKTEGKIYDLDRLDSRDPYETFLSGAVSLIRIQNPNANTDKKLIVFRDSYGSSLIPLLVGAYAEITVVDTRYINPILLGNADYPNSYVDFSAADDVLFLYSTTVLNDSGTLRK